MSYDINYFINFQLMRYKSNKHHIHAIDFNIPKTDIVIYLHYYNYKHNIEQIYYLIIFV